MDSICVCVCVVRYTDAMEGFPGYGFAQEISYWCLALTVVSRCGLVIHLNGMLTFSFPSLYPSVSLLNRMPRENSMSNIKCLWEKSEAVCHTPRKWMQRSYNSYERAWSYKSQCEFSSYIGVFRFCIKDMIAFSFFIYTDVPNTKLHNHCTYNSPCLFLLFYRSCCEDSKDHRKSWRCTCIQLLTFVVFIFRHLSFMLLFTSFVLVQILIRILLIIGREWVRLSVNLAGMYVASFLHIFFECAWKKNYQ